MCCAYAESSLSLNMIIQYWQMRIADCHSRDVDRETSTALVSDYRCGLVFLCVTMKRG